MNKKNDELIVPKDLYGASTGYTYPKEVNDDVLTIEKMEEAMKLLISERNNKMLESINRSILTTRMKPSIEYESEHFDKMHYNFRSLYGLPVRYTSYVNSGEAIAVNGSLFIGTGIEQDEPVIEEDAKTIPQWVVFMVIFAVMAIVMLAVMV